MCVLSSLIASRSGIRLASVIVVALSAQASSSLKRSLSCRCYGSNVTYVVTVEIEHSSEEVAGTAVQLYASNASTHAVTVGSQRAQSMLLILLVHPDHHDQQDRLPGGKGKQCHMLQSMVTMLCKIPVTGWILRSNHRKGWILCGNHRRSRRSPHPLCGSCWSILTPGGALLVHLGARSASDTLISGDVCGHAQLHNTQQRHIQLGDPRNTAEFRFDIGKDVSGKTPLLPRTILGRQEQTIGSAFPGHVLNCAWQT